MQIVVPGQGYVGLPLAVRAAEVGHRVVGYDVDTHRVQQLTAGQSYVDDVASCRLRAVLDSGAYSATADAAALAGFDLAVITVPTPLRHGVADLTYVESCARTLGCGDDAGHCPLSGAHPMGSIRWVPLGGVHLGIVFKGQIQSRMEAMVTVAW